MHAKNERVPWWRRYFSRAILLALVAAVASALYYTNDTYVMHNIIVSEDKLNAMLAFLLIGSWVGVPATYLNCSLFGRTIDKDFKGVRLYSKKTQLLALLAGAFGVVSTALYLKAAQEIDASVLVALANISLVYLVIYDLLRGNVRGSWIIPSLLAVLIGCFLASIKELRFSLDAFSWKAILLLAIGKGGTSAIGKIAEQGGSKSSDGASFSFWRMLWFAIVATILVFAISFGRGCLASFCEMVGNVLLRAIPWAAISLFFASLAGILENTAKKYGAVSVVTMVVGLSVVLGIPLTLSLNAFAPGIFGNIPREGSIWLARLVGTALLFWGVNNVRKNEAKISR